MTKTVQAAQTVQPAQTTQPINPAESEVPPYVCPRCFLGFLTLFSFNRHVRDQHPIPSKPLHNP